MVMLLWVLVVWALKKNNVSVNLEITQKQNKIIAHESLSMNIIEFVDDEGIFQRGVDRQDINEELSISCALISVPRILKMKGRAY